MVQHREKSQSDERRSPLRNYCSRLTEHSFIVLDSDSSKVAVYYAFSEGIAKLARRPIIPLLKGSVSNLGTVDIDEELASVRELPDEIAFGRTA